jgi:glycosyltransferase involved in cell wall biosynthesis
MSGATVSVIVPMYNGEAYIRESVESALAQTHRPSEIIVLDDGSTDGGGAIAQGLAVTYVRQANAGLAAARNAAIERASGDYIALLDCDDIWLPEKLDRQLAALDADPSAGYALCHIRYLFDEGAAPPAWFKQIGPDEGEAGYSPSCWLIRRSAWEKVGPFSLEYDTEDIDWLARAMEAGVRSVMAPEVLVLKRIHGSNLSGNVPTIYRGLLGALRGHVARSRGQGS